MAKLRASRKRALRKLWLAATPHTSKGKPMFGVNARRRRQARKRAELKADMAVVDRLQREWDHMVSVGAVGFIEF